MLDKSRSSGTPRLPNDASVLLSEAKSPGSGRRVANLTRREVEVVGKEIKAGGGGGRNDVSISRNAGACLMESGGVEWLKCFLKHS